MTSSQREAIRSLRLQGLSYGLVSERTGICKDTIKSFCHRNGLAGIGAELADGIKKNDKNVLCKNCGKSLTQQNNIKKRVFCCDKCRVEWWHRHPERIKKKAIYYFICINCGKTFSAYGNSNRKYCCHECYIQDRFGAAEENE